MKLQQAGIETQSVLLTTPEGEIVMDVGELRFPFLDGVARPSPGLVALDVQRASRAEVVDST